MIAPLNTPSVASRYTSLTSGRSPFLDRARECAKLTIPTLMVPEGSTSTSTFPTPFQAVGARGVNNLAAKLLLALFPMTPFFKLSLDEVSKATLETTAQRAQGEVENVFSMLERTVMNEVDAQHLRTPAFEALKHLITTGNALLYLPPSGGMRLFTLERYVIVRDPLGSPVEIIVKETFAPASLPKDLLSMLDEGVEDKEDRPSAERTIDIYTSVRREPGKDRWEVLQECRGKNVPGSRGFYPLDACPWLPLRMIRVDGESYGRGLVEEYLGDLRSLEALSQALVEGAAAAAKILVMVRPNGTTRADRLAKAESGAVIEGDANDVSILSLEKYNDFRVAFEQAQRIEKRLEFAFLITASIQRNGERVTAEEVRRMAQDLEVALGGVYALLTQELQLPLVRLLMQRLRRQGRFPALPQSVRPAVVGGMEALGRGNDLANLLGLMEDLTPLMPILQDRLNVDEIVRRLAAARGIPTKGLLSDPPTQEDQTNAQMQEALMNAAPSVLNTIAKGAVEQAPLMSEGVPSSVPTPSSQAGS